MHIANYSQTYKVDGAPGFPYWWPTNMTTNSKCPRSLDCPDWRYMKEEPYSRQIKLLKSLSKVLDINKVSIGFETLGVDVLVQHQSYLDKALPWTTVTNKERWEHQIYFHNCTKNLTLADPLGDHKCGQPLLEEQWGLKFNASEIKGLNLAVKDQIDGAELAGIGTFTLDGMMWQPEGQTQRFWYKELCELNKDYQLPCSGPCCTQEHFDTPLLPPPADDEYIFSIAPEAAGGVADQSADATFIQ